MIYVEEVSFERQLKILSEFLTQKDFELVAWLYPESHLGSFLGLDVLEATAVPAVPVTHYDHDVISKCTPRTCFDTQLINKILKEKEIVVKECDSLCLYPVREREWQVCTVGHEGIVLVKDDSHIEYLKSCGFNASLQAPEWW